MNNMSSSDLLRKLNFKSIIIMFILKRQNKCLSYMFRPAELGVNMEIQIK